MQCHDGSNKGTALHFVQISGKCAMEIPGMVRQAFGEESMIRTRKVQLNRPQKARQMKSKVKSMLIIFFDIKGIVHKAFILAGQTVY
jgi:hypothetical protein